jgi:hypothetical protein
LISLQPQAEVDEASAEVWRRAGFICQKKSFRKQRRKDFQYSLRKLIARDERRALAAED